MKRERILECAFDEMAVRGIKHASIDNIALRMHISKKTIYDLFENKEKLLLSALKCKIGKIIAGFSDPLSDGRNVLSSIICNALHLFKFVYSVTPSFYKEIELFSSIKGYVDSVKVVMMESGKKRVEEGKEMGYFREDADFSIVGKLFELQMISMLEDDKQKYTPLQICFYSFMIIIRGICTEQGLKFIEENIDEAYIEKLLR